jgi:hypothetical protein
MYWCPPKLYSSAVFHNRCESQLNCKTYLTLGVLLCSLVKHLEAVADIAWVRRQLKKGKRLGAVNVQDKYAILEIANKLSFPFVHKIVLEE